MDSLEQLAQRVEALTGPCRETDALVEASLGIVPDGSVRCKGGWIIDGSAVASPKYTASLDAAMTLVPEGWSWDISTRPDSSGGVVYLHSPDRTKWRDTGGFAATPELALCAAALRARKDRQ